MGQDILLGLVHELGQLRQAWSHLVGYLAPLGLGRGLVLLGEDGADEGGGEATAVAPSMGQQVAHEMHAAALPGGIQHSACGGLQPLVGIGDHQLDAAQATTGQSAKEVDPERRASEQPTAMPSTSRRPSLFTPTAMVAATGTTRPPWRTFT